eukprot:1330975-Rhodomonas_salina.2
MYTEYSRISAGSRAFSPKPVSSGSPQVRSIDCSSSATCNISTGPGRPMTLTVDGSVKLLRPTKFSAATLALSSSPFSSSIARVSAKTSPGSHIVRPGARILTGSDHKASLPKRTSPEHRHSSPSAEHSWKLPPTV